MDIDNILTTFGTAALGAISWMFASNVKLKEGFSDLILKHLNKTKVNKIPLTQHKLFSLLEQKESSLATFIIDDPIKMTFYQTYINIVFRHIRGAGMKIVKAEEKDLTIENVTMGIVYHMHGQTANEVSEALNIPDKVEASFSKWRAMMTSSCNESLKEILGDDLIDSNYIAAYRALDVLMFYVNTLLHTGAVEMSRLNGSFKGLKLNDILKVQTNDN